MFGVEIDPELRRLDGNLRVEPGRLDLVEDVEIMLRDPFRFVELCHPLAEPGEDGVDPLRLQRGRRLQRVVDLLAGHERVDRLAHERALRRLLA